MASSVNSEVRIRLIVYFFTSGEPPLCDRGGQSCVGRGQVQWQKGAQWLLRATVRPYVQRFNLGVLHGALVHTVQSAGVMLHAGNSAGDHLGVALTVQREDDCLLQNDGF